MRFGLNFTPVYPGEMAGLARVAEDAGYESLWIGEHVLVPFDAVPEGDRGNFRANSRFLEPWVALAHLAAVTSTVRLGTCVAVLPLHHPVHLARAVATVDVLSNGRVSVGAGIGLIPAEYSAVNEDYGSRGARLDEMIEVMNVLFREAEPEFHGRYFDFAPSGFEPKPVQQPRPPMLIGGSSPAAFRRCVELGDGWFGGSPSPQDAARTVSELQARRADSGRPPLEITLLSGWGTGFDGDRVRGYEDAGVDRLMVTPWTSSRSAREGILRFAEQAGLA